MSGIDPADDGPYYDPDTDSVWGEAHGAPWERPIESTGYEPEDLPPKRKQHA